jgi:hypothetical protein
VTLLLVLASAASAAPVTTAPPYVVPSADSVDTTAILTVGDSVPEADAATDTVDWAFVGGVLTQTTQDGQYRMVGIPDGLGAFDSDGGDTFTVLMNHEIGGAQGVVHDHGSVGSFVSRWEIRKSDLRVMSGDDQIKRVLLYDSETDGFLAAGTFPFNRFCSGDLPAQSALYDPKSGLGTLERIYLNGEETRPSFDPRYGKAVGHVLTGSGSGDSYELNDIGEMSFENVVASPYPQEKTIVFGLDDSTNALPGAAFNANNPPSEVYVYVGQKQSTGNPVERAGLVGGDLFGVKVVGDPTEATVTGGERFSLFEMSGAAQDNGFTLQSESAANGVTQFRRVEDGQWDPTKKNDFYFVTTDAFPTNASTGLTRVWRLRFDDVTQPELGGEIQIIYAASPGHTEGGTVESEPQPGEMFDNMTVDNHGRVLLQEDPGNNVHLARIWALNPSTGRIAEVAIHDPALFTGTPAPKTLDEESSGIIDVSAILGADTYLFDVQAHRAVGDAELVEDGQLLAMTVGFRDLRDLVGRKVFPTASQ